MIRVGLIGYGYAGRTFHAPLIRSTPGFELAAVGSSRPDRVHADLPEVPVVASPEEICAMALDLVVVATPNETHHAIATLALNAGKHVVVEKPFGPTLERARALAALARRTERMLAVFQNRRWDGDFLAVARVVADGAVGPVAHFESHFDRYRPTVRDRWREHAGLGAGLWFDLGPHLVDQALQLFGLPDRIIASLAAQRAGAQTNDWAHAVLEYERLRVVLHTSVLVAAPLPRFAVHGQTGSWIKYGLDPQEGTLAAALRPDAVPPGAGLEHATLVDGASGTTREVPLPPGDYRQFYLGLRDALDVGGSNPVPPEQALAVTAVVETVMRASAEGRAFRLPLTDEEIQRFTRTAPRPDGRAPTVG